LSAKADETARRLAIASDAYVVQRSFKDGPSSATILAGYHWFVRIGTRLQDISLPVYTDPPDKPCGILLSAIHSHNLEWGLRLHWNYEPNHEETEDWIQFWQAGPHSPGRNMTLHNATLHGFCSENASAYEFIAVAPGRYTIWLRPVSDQGMTGPFYKLICDYGPPYEYLKWQSRASTSGTGGQPPPSRSFTCPQAPRPHTARSPTT
jgi:hypothetical protein